MESRQPISVPEPFRNPLAPVAPRRAPTLLPLIGRSDDITPALERTLWPVALRAREDDWAARDALFAAFEPKLQRIARNLWTPPASPTTVGVWEHDDVWQEAWLVFATLVEAWRPEIPFGRYVLANFPWRLRDAIRRNLARPSVPPRWYAANVRNCEDHASPNTGEATDNVLIDTLCDELGEPGGQVARLHILHNLSIREAATELHLGERTASRHWRNTRTRLREVLTGD